MSIDEIRKRAAYCEPEATGSYQHLARAATDREDMRWSPTAAQDAIADRAVLLGLLDKLTAVTSELDDEPWQSERPTAGRWWVALAPEHRRNPCVPVREAEVEGGIVIFGADFWARDSERFVGALWLKREVPSDPFGRGGGE